ncbi:MAG: hypothetical protein IJT91_03565 [Clostridia bacterium]|nr:hypothetical protein [Clostridia bacterium]
MDHKKLLIISAAAFVISVILLIIPAHKTNTNEKKSTDLLAGLEQKTGEMLERLDGISDISVMISLKDNDEGGRYTAYYSSKNENDEISGLYSKISGIAIICKGGSDPSNQARIIKLISSLYGIPTNRIFVGE